MQAMTKLMTSIDHVIKTLTPESAKRFYDNLEDNSVHQTIFVSRLKREKLLTPEIEQAIKG
jgi:hypothetical protein